MRREMPPPGYQPAPIRLPAVRPVVTYTLLVIMVVVFILQQAGSAFFANFDVTYTGLKINELIQMGQYWRLITPMFLHGSILHLGFNAYALFIFGPGLERHFGHLRFITLFLLSGFAGNVMSFMFSAAPSLGSSTAIFGLLGAEGVFLYRNQRLFGSQARRALNNLIVIAVINFMIGLSARGQIDNWGHLGGLIGGTIFAWFGGPVLTVQQDYSGLSMVDTREPRDAILAGVLDFLVFGGLALATIFMRAS